MHDKTIPQAIVELSTSEQGLSSTEAASRLARDGQNVLEQKKAESPVGLFLSQFKGFLVGILIAALVVSVFLRAFVDAAVIGAILILNAILGFVQEYNAEKSIEALRKLSSLRAKVIRDGRIMEIESRDLVMGDLIVLDEGMRVPADCRISKAVYLVMDEASLTGESMPVRKDSGVVAVETPLADRTNMAYSGTIVSQGKGQAYVISTGMRTEIGKIASLIQEPDEGLTPLQRSLQGLGRWLGGLAIVVCLIVFAAGVIGGKTIADMFISSVSLAVAAVPEGLPAVVTISLALGTSRMVKRNALVRRLPSVETLGCTTVICTDKTGTLTCNEMTVRRIYANRQDIEVTGEGYKTSGAFSKDPKAFAMLLTCGTLCNDATIDGDKVIGDPTEAALIVSAAKAGITRESVSKFMRIDEIPFDSRRKSMITLHDDGKRRVAFIKGAPDIIIRRCDHILLDGEVHPIRKADISAMLAQTEQYAMSAMRVLGFGYQPVRKDEKLPDEGYIFLGLQAMIDPPRPEVRQAIARCEKAGIKVVMITGDHRITAEAIAREIGIPGKSITGEELDKIGDFDDHVEEYGVYARVNPEHKMLIIEALRRRHHIVAMGGDGVNDAPALKKADLGVAMGITGTDVAKEASDMILMDDNFSTVVNAVEEGRGVYDNIKKFVMYLLSSNLGEILTVLLAIIIGFSIDGELILPLIAIQILWMNLITDGLPAIALAVEPLDPRAMDRKPRKQREKLVNGERTATLVVIGIVMAVGTLFIFSTSLHRSAAYAQTMAFTTLVIFQLFNVLNFRSEKDSLFVAGPLKNKWLLLAILGSLTMQLAVLYTPLASVFRTVPLGLMDWVEIVVVSSLVIWVIEILKAIRRMRKGEQVVVKVEPVEQVIAIARS